MRDDTASSKFILKIMTNMIIKTFKKPQKGVAHLRITQVPSTAAVAMPSWGMKVMRFGGLQDLSDLSRPRSPPGTLNPKP